MIPVCGILTALALCNSLSPEVGLRSLGNAIRKVYTFFLGLVMTLLLALLSSQNTLCAAADSTGARTAKLVSSTIIPTVGGSVGETLRTVASGVQYLKSVVGISSHFHIGKTLPDPFRGACIQLIIQFVVTAPHVRFGIGFVPDFPVDDFP